VRFTHPLLLVLAVLLPWVIARGRNARVRRGGIALRVASLLALILASAGASILHTDGSAAVMFVVDRSSSVTPRAQMSAMERIARMTRGMGAADRVGIVAFGRDAVVDRPLGTGSVSTALTSDVDAGGTDIEAALRVARSALPSDGDRRIVLMSDGRETAGDAVRESRAAAAATVAVDVIPLAAGTRGAVARVAEVSAPAAVSVGEPFGVRVRADGRAGTSTAILVQRDGRQIAVQNVTFDGAHTAVVRIEDRIADAGAVTYTASAGEVTEAGAVVMASGTPRLLYVGGGSATLRDVPDAHAYRVDRILPRDLRATRGALSIYDAVILDDVAAEELDERQTRSLAEYVERHGGGLLMRGGERALEPSGFPRTPLGASLPIDLRRRGGSRAPDLALAIVFDKSGSMADAVGDVTKIELARRAVVAVQQVLPAGDSLGVIAFDAQPSAIAPLAAGHDAEDLRKRLRGIDAGGSTAIAPAVALACDWLRRSGAARRQVLLLSDGRSNPDDAARLLALAGSDGIALSVVAIGSDIDRPFFRALAAKGGGRVFFPDDVRTLPEVLAREAARASGGWRVRERFTPRAPHAHPMLAGIDRAAIPPLDGYVAASAKPGAEVAIESHLSDPVLAGWRYGLGRVTVFTGAISQEFERWPYYRRLWRQAIRWTARGRAAPSVEASLEPRPGGATLVVNGVDPSGAFINNLAARAIVTAPRGTTQSIELGQTAAGRYEADVETPAPGTYLAAVDLRDPASGDDTRALAGFFWMPPGERPGAEADLAKLAEIASNGGGRMLGAQEHPFQFQRRRGYRNLSTPLAILGLILFVADIAVRRGAGIALVRAAWRRRTAHETVAT
jgi:Ca-activated chloride channel family protein